MIKGHWSMTADAPTTIPSSTSYNDAEAIARSLSDADLLRIAGALSPAQCRNVEMAANHEVNRRFQRLRERLVSLNTSMDNLVDKHEALQEKFDSLVATLHRARALLAGRESENGVGRA
jgi:hypothetical protein